MKKITLIAAAVAAFGVSAQANAFTSSSILFDRDGAGGSTAIEIASFDWRAGNALAKDAINAAPDANGFVYFTTYFQASLAQFRLPGDLDESESVLGTSEFTVVATIFEKGTGLGTAGASFESLGGTYEIFYQAVRDANSTTGTGFDNGTRILLGEINPGGEGTFTNFTIKAYQEAVAAWLAIPGNPAPFPFPNGPEATLRLDSIGGDSKPSVYSHEGGGNSTLYVNVKEFDAAFFKSNIATLMVDDLRDTTNLAAPFADVNPSALVVGQTPNYGTGYYNLGPTEQGFGLVNGAGCGDFAPGVKTCDFQFQSDSTTSFTTRSVPEPGSLAIAGAGLALMSLIRRRKSK